MEMGVFSEVGLSSFSAGATTKSKKYPGRGGNDITASHLHTTKFSPPRQRIVCRSLISGASISTFSGEVGYFWRSPPFGGLAPSCDGSLRSYKRLFMEFWYRHFTAGPFCGTVGSLPSQ